VASGIQLLRREVSSERGTEYLTMMQAANFRMFKLVDNMLDFARGRLGGGMELDRHNGLAVETLLKEVVDELTLSMPAWRIETVFRLSQPVNADGPRIGQLTSNLLANALTHGAPEGAVLLTAESSNEEFVLTVANSGSPIPSEAMDRLFPPLGCLYGRRGEPEINRCSGVLSAQVDARPGEVQPIVAVGCRAVAELDREHDRALRQCVGIDTALDVPRQCGGVEIALIQGCTVGGDSPPGQFPRNRSQRGAGLGEPVAAVDDAGGTQCA
jgi:hypothetical protein